MNTLFPVLSRTLHMQVKGQVAQLLRVPHLKSITLTLPPLLDAGPANNVSDMHVDSEWVLVAYLPPRQSYIIKARGGIYHNLALPQACDQCKLYDGSLLMGELLGRELYITDAAVLAGNYILNKPFEERVQSLQSMQSCGTGLKFSRDLATLYDSNVLCSRLWR